MHPFPQIYSYLSACLLEKLQRLLNQVPHVLPLSLVVLDLVAAVPVLVLVQVHHRQ